MQSDNKVLSWKAPPNKIACGFYHSASISNLETGHQLYKTDFTQLYTWGRSGSWLGHGECDKGDKLAPTRIQDPADSTPDSVLDTQIYEVACGTSHTLALIRTDKGGSHVYACGLNAGGRLGSGQATSPLPERVQNIFQQVKFSSEFAGQSVLRICCGADHSLCLTAAGTVLAWGVNTEGQCGVNRSSDEVRAPEPIAPFPALRGGGPAQVVHLAAGGRHSLMITGEGPPQQGGLLYAWGCNQQARLGLGHQVNQQSPCPVATIWDTQLTAVAGGEAHSGAIDVKKKLWMWGVGANGRLGLGETMDVPSPRRVRFPDDHGVLQLALGGFHSVALCAVNKAKRLYSWGCGEALGLLANGDNTVIVTPRPVDLLGSRDTENPLQIAAGTYHTLVLMENGDLMTFGQGAACGRLRTGKVKNNGLPSRIAGSFGFSILEPNGTNPGKVVRSLKHKSETRKPKSEQAEVMNELWEIKQVACGDMFSAALTHGGSLWVWGCSEHGQLGFGNKEDSVVPKLLRFENDKRVVEIALGNDHCLAITLDGLIYGWGKGEHGQLGTGGNEDTLIPARINEVKEAIAVSAGDEHSAAICRFQGGNQLWTWGSTHTGKLGIANSFSVATIPPTAVEEFHGADARVSPISVSCGQYHTAVICLGGEEKMPRKRIFTFGGGWYGRLGHGKMENEYRPKCVEGLKGSAHLVVCGTDHTCALSQPETGEPEPGGTLWVWGRGKMVCNTDNVLEPKQVSVGNVKFVSVVCGHTHTLVISQDGDVFAWGNNSDGQLGPVVESEGGDDNIAPKRIRLQEKPCLMATGPAHTIAVFRSKDTYSWGNQCFGRLGLAQRTAAKVVERPAKVDAKWASIEAMGQSTDKAEELVEEDPEEEESSEEEAKETSGANKEQTLLQWWRAHLPMLQKIEAQVPGGEGRRITVESVSQVTGETALALVGGVQTQMFELRFHMDIRFQKVTGKGRQQKRQQGSKGRVGLLEFSSMLAKAGKPFPVEVTMLSDEEKELVMQHFVPALTRKLSEYISESQAEAASLDVKLQEQEQPESNARLLQAVTAKPTKECQFSTMQALLKNEPEDCKLPALRAQEVKLSKELEAYVQQIGKLPEMEQKVVQLQCDFEQSLCANLRFIRKLPGPDHGNLVRGPIASKLGYYEELLWVLQQQAFYLATLSMLLDTGDEDTFEAVVGCLYAEMDDPRTRDLFVALLRLIIFKEIEQAKTLKGLFRQDSRVFRMFKKFALDKVHYKEVVHTIMNWKDQDSLLGRVMDMVNQNHVIAFNQQDYQDAPQNKDRLKDYQTLEVKNEFSNAVPAIRRFFGGGMPAALRKCCLPKNIRKLFNYSMQEIKKRRYPDATSTSDISLEMMMYTPMLYIFVMGILVPMLEDPQRYASHQVLLSPNWKDSASEEDVVYTLQRLREMLEASMTPDETWVKGNPLLESIAKALRPELLKYLMDQVVDTVDDTDSLLTINLYISHFQRTCPTVSVPTSTLMKLSNLLRRNLGKLRINQEDPVDRLCEQIGKWSEEEIRAAEGNETVHNFAMNTRFLFKDKRAVICSTSHCPVPERLSATLSDEGKDSSSSSSMLIAPFSADRSKYSNFRPLEDLFFELDLLKSDSFDGLIDELQQKAKAAQGKSHFGLAQKLVQGLKLVHELQSTGATPRELLEWIMTAVNERARRRRYLENLKREISAIRWAEKRHSYELAQAEQELAHALEMSRSASLPKAILHHGNHAGKRLRLEVVSKKLEQVQSLGREKIQDCSYSPMITKSLQQLRREHIVKDVANWLDEHERLGGNVQITFTLKDSGVDMIASVSRVKAGRTIRSNLKYMQIPQEKLRDLRRAQEDQVLSLPTDKPLVTFMSSNLVAMLHKLATGTY